MMALQRIAVTTLVASVAAVLAVPAHAQDAELQCQYLTVTTDPISVVNEITPVFDVTIRALETNKNETKLTKATGLAGDEDGVEFEENGVVLGGNFFAEVDAKLKATDAPDITCADTAKVSGVGQLVVDDDDVETWVIRDGSRLDGKTRLFTAATCPDDFDPLLGDNCSVHPVKASLRVTAQGERGNGSLKYERSTLNQKDIIAATNDEDQDADELVLACSCVNSPAAPTESGEPE
ncbi:MAG: hypothetical protein AAF637_06095 [Pseudomonadota bacterium]